MFELKIVASSVSELKTNIRDLANMFNSTAENYTDSIIQSLTTPTVTTNGQLVDGITASLKKGYYDEKPVKTSNNVEVNSKKVQSSSEVLPEPKKKQAVKQVKQEPVASAPSVPVVTKDELKAKIGAVIGMLGNSGPKIISTIISENYVREDGEPAKFATLTDSGKANFYEICNGYLSGEKKAVDLVKSTAEKLNLEIKGH